MNTDHLKDKENNKPLASGLEMPESQQECYIGGTPNGKRFLELMHRDTEDMATMKGLNNNHDPWRADDRIWFEDSIYAMLEGRRASGIQDVIPQCSTFTTLDVQQ